MTKQLQKPSGVSVSKLPQEQTLKVDLLLQELKNVDWDTLGTYLGLSQSEIRDIERDHQKTERRRSEMFDMWLRKEENPSWVKIIAALENMLETRLVSQLRKRYQQQPNDGNPPVTRCLKAEDSTDQQAATERVLRIDRKDQVARELESIKKCYIRLMMSAESALETANPSPRQLKRFSQSYMSDQVVTTVEELFDCLGELSFLDYALLEHTISMFLEEAQPVVSDLSDYIQQLNNFKESTTLNELMETIENAHKSKEGTGACTVTLRLVGGWLPKTMEDLDKLLKEIFQDKSSVLAHLTIIRGSVIVSYLAPQSEADSLLKLAQAKLSFMAQVGVLQTSLYRALPIVALLSSLFPSSLHRAKKLVGISKDSFSTYVVCGNCYSIYRLSECMKDDKIYPRRCDNLALSHKYMWSLLVRAYFIMNLVYID